MLDAFLIARTQDEATARLHAPPAERQSGTDFIGLVEEQHRANFDLWHEEDKARVPGAADEEIAAVKRAIDPLNQRRNDLMEKVDLALIEGLAQNEAAPLHSETPGLMIDRMSILSLKIYHTREESVRTSATEAHRRRNAERLVLLEEQRLDLTGCLDALWTEVESGTRRFKLYRQMKMYNDPELNPAVYGKM